MSPAPIQDTIAALATPPGAGALAIVRLSGSDAVDVAAKVFTGKRTLESLGGFEGAHGWIRSGDGLEDEVIAWVYRAPNSYTGEDMVEFSCHGGALPSRRVLAALLGIGARPGDPGEFTRRAFLGGRIDLAQAEAVADLIAARGRRAQEQALHQLSGGLSRRVRAIAQRVRGVMAEIEGHLDFGDDVPEVPEASTLVAVLGEAASELERLAASHAPSRRARDGMVIALAGRPNVGKSSLLNALLGFDRAIVHTTPGTTRDVVEEVVEWSGVPVRLVDTAGLREQAGPVEVAGMERSHRELGRADLVLWVVDVSKPPGIEDTVLVPGLDLNRVHLVLNKQDLGTQPLWHEWVNNHSLRLVHEISALTGTGVDDLQKRLETELLQDLIGTLEAEDLWVANERHAHLLDQAALALGRARTVLAGTSHPLELAAADLHRALESLATITGDQAGVELLDEIFKRFCIGK